MSTITRGLFAGQVLQRNKTNKATIKAHCELAPIGPVFAQVKAGKKSIVKKQRVGEIKRGKGEIKLSGIPLGGPYTIVLSFASGPDLEVGDIRVGDVWIMAGQSNMEGLGFLKYALKGHKDIRCFYQSDNWTKAQDPMGYHYDAVDTVHRSNPEAEKEARKSFKQRGTGPGLAFAMNMHNDSGVPQGLIACAHGGSTMESWHPKGKRKGGATLYGAMMRRIEKLNQPLAGVIWYQGESEAFVGTEKIYTRSMKNLVSQFRKQIGQATLPWVTVQLGQVFMKVDSGWINVQEHQRLLPNHIKKLETVPAMDTACCDCIHIGSKGQHVIGKRLAQAMIRLKGGKGRKPVELSGIKLVKNNLPLSGPLICVSFKNVRGALSSTGPVSGFFMVTKDGERFKTVHRVFCKGKSVYLDFGVDKKGAKNWRVSYGYLPDSICNVTDEDGWSLPVFAPHKIA
ncbi:MAG: hypothetical protein HRT89_03525 [Lentisphaeria bacterium]|nr:hypothetical protein [Lentisphaeria bacterium]